jgi:hypothetical protein
MKSPRHNGGALGYLGLSRATRESAICIPELPQNVQQ